MPVVNLTLNDRSESLSFGLTSLHAQNIKTPGKEMDYKDKEVTEQDNVTEDGYCPNVPDGHIWMQTLKASRPGFPHGHSSLSFNCEHSCKGSFEDMHSIQPVSNSGSLIMLFCILIGCSVPYEKFQEIK